MRRGPCAPSASSEDALASTQTRTLPPCKDFALTNSEQPAIRALKLSLTCRYSFEVWGTKILSAIEDQGLLLSDLARRTSRDVSQQQHSSPLPTHHSPAIEDDDPETLSRKDVAWTPITGPDKILDWSVFPPEKPTRTLPDSAFIAKPNPYALGEKRP